MILPSSVVRLSWPRALLMMRWNVSTGLSSAQPHEKMFETRYMTWKKLSSEAAGCWNFRNWKKLPAKRGAKRHLWKMLRAEELSTFRLALRTLSWWRGSQRVARPSRSQQARSGRLLRWRSSRCVARASQGQRSRSRRSRSQRSRSQQSKSASQRVQEGQPARPRAASHRKRSHSQQSKSGSHKKLGHLNLSPSMKQLTCSLMQ
mmetsp:Transcript_159142/g.296576  ORF Transcript_159142/g.296576 Transcript_159142/m.296576 type:complete len:204 (-) Transcript_159142:266-877(-)